MKASREEALRALNEPVINWIDQAEVEYEPRPATTVFRVELSPDDLAWLFEEAGRRGVNPLAVIQGLVSQARRAANSSSADQDAGAGPPPSAPRSEA